LATGKTLDTNHTTKNTHRLKLVKNTLTVGTWNVQTLWAAGKLELLRNEMKRFRYDIIGMRQKIRNDDIRIQILKEETIVDTIKRRKLGLFGHICRMEDSRLIKHIVFGKMNGKPRQGRPCKEWLDDIVEWCGSSVHDLFHKAQNREVWKKLVRTVVGPYGR
jgi:hypothetical protein